MLQTEIAARHTREAIEQEIRVFEERAGQLIRGEITDDQFRPFRLKHGTYGQRQPGFQMLRVKIPSGILDAAQLRALADIGDNCSNGRAMAFTGSDSRVCRWCARSFRAAWSPPRNWSGWRKSPTSSAAGAGISPRGRMFSSIL